MVELGFGVSTTSCGGVELGLGFEIGGGLRGESTRSVWLGQGEGERVVMGEIWERLRERFGRD